jgi:16S rRNA (guanine527-N7)-methyltransferase
MTELYRKKLSVGIQSLGISLSDEAVERLLAYHELLVKWNKAYNLTSVRDPSEMIDRHLIDSLSMVHSLNDQPLIDVGTGPGLPGMVIALIKPELPVWLLDSNGKKTRFLNQVKMVLKVDNVTVVHHRLESWQPDAKFAQITSRAFATLSDMVAFSRHLLAEDGRFIAMKGVYPQAEIDQLPQDIEVKSVSPLNVPGTDGERHLVELGIQNK